MLSELSSRVINLPPDRLDDAIENALKRVMEFFQIDRCALLRTLPGKTTWQITHVASSSHAPPVPKGEVLHMSINPWAYEILIEKEEILAFSSLDEVPPEAAVDKQTWMNWGIRSNLVIPILSGASIDHLIVINSIRCERVWPEEYFPRLQLFGEILVNALERREKEESLRDTEERVSLAAASAEAGLWVIDAATGRIWATDKLRDIFRFSPDEDLSFDRFLEAVHPEDRQSARDTLALCLRNRELTRLEYRILLPDGTVRWIVSRGRSYPATSVHPERVMGVSIDVTPRKEMEERLHAQLEEIHRLKRELEQENVYLREEVLLHQEHGEIVARSEAMKRVLAQVEQVASTDAAVLVQGETGTGKELLARHIHRLSRRRDRQLVTLNCAVLPPTLVESELFGREKGAYTGALTRMAGRFEVAHRSTFFLDEIGELPLDLQGKLLRVLEEGRFERLGSTRSLKVDVRIIAATNRDLARAVSEGRFRADLFYRLNVFPIVIPPLRERTEDIPPLVWAFVKRNEKKLGKRVERIPRRSMDALLRHHWPGNARELRNIVEHAMITGSGGTLRLRPPSPAPADVPTQGRLEDVERRHILGILEKTGWRISGENGAAEILGLKRSTLQARMKKLGIRRPAP
jgi:PAS domain S-box-containing protein